MYARFHVVQTTKSWAGLEVTYGTSYVRGDIAPGTNTPIVGDTQILHDNAFDVSGKDHDDATMQQMNEPGIQQIELQRDTTTKFASTYTFSAVGGQTIQAAPIHMPAPVTPAFDVGNTLAASNNPVTVRLYWLLFCSD